jgi:hypothetical protein
VNGSGLVADPPIDVAPTPNPPSERNVVDDGSDGERNVADEVASSRVRFIRQFALGKGVSSTVLEKRWRDKKNGYPRHYDRPFEEFRLWWISTQRGTEFSPTHLQPGLITEYLTLLSSRGVHHDTLRDVSTSISMACVEASDGEYQPGMAYSVKSFMEGERRQRPVRRDDNGSYGDVALLYQEAWLYGPDSALALGHQKEKIILLLLADTAARPSDLSKLYRTQLGFNQQVVFTPAGMNVRFFYTKEVVPGSSRNNSTGYYFTTWVEVKNTVPLEISTPACLRRFFEASTGDEFAMTEVPLLNISAQSFVYARKVNGKFQPASVNHISNVAKSGLAAAGLTSMTARSLRGASPSKIVQLFPELLDQALKLGRWTNPKTFRNHYQGPVALCTTERPPEILKGNLQQLLRWGFKPIPPIGISSLDYMKGPEFWVGQTVEGLGKIVRFHESVFEVHKSGRRLQTLYHYELMSAVSIARRSSGVV